MPKASPIRSTFNAGELSPLLDGRVDIAKYNNGCRVMENFIPTVQGPAVRRAGTKYVAETNDSNYRSWLIPFVFNNSQAFVLEFGNYYIRFYTNHGQVLSGLLPYEVATPYPASALTNADGTLSLDYVQSGDVIYFTHPSYPIQKLSRYGNTNWTFGAVTLTGGPFKTINSNRSITVQASAASGSVTLTASSAIFSASHVGAYFFLQAADLSGITPWTAGEEFAAGVSPLGVLRRASGRTYQCATSGSAATGKYWRTGGNMPLHTYGTQKDGSGKPYTSGGTNTNVTLEGLDWTFLDPGYGYLQITGYTDSTHVTATVKGSWNLPQQVVGVSTYKWAFGAFSAVEGYPTNVTFFRERLCFAKDQTLYFSASADFENFSALDDTGQVNASQSIIATISTDQPQPIQWMIPQSALLIGTAGAEYICAENSSQSVFAPGNVKIEQQTTEGSNGVFPATVGFSTLFVQRSGRKLKEAAFNLQQEGYITTDLTALSEHITQGGIIQVVWHKEPYVALWAVRSDGVLLGFTFNKEQDVVAWHRHPMTNGIVESVAVIPSPDGTRDELWLIVNRNIDGYTKRYVEYLNREYITGDAQDTCFYVDCGLTYYGAATSTISGLGHLNNQTVSVLADGSAHPDCVVSFGSITLQRAASRVQVGLPMTSTLQTTRIEAGAGDGTAQGKMKRVNKCVIRFYNTLGANAGPDENTLDEIEFRDPSMPMDQPPAIFTGDKLIEWPDGYNFDGYVMVKQTQPLPMTVVAIMPQLHTFDR